MRCERSTVICTQTTSPKCDPGVITTWRLSLVEAARSRHVLVCACSACGVHMRLCRAVLPVACAWDAISLPTAAFCEHILACSCRGCTLPTDEPTSSPPSAARAKSQQSRSGTTPKPCVSEAPATVTRCILGNSIAETRVTMVRAARIATPRCRPRSLQPHPSEGCGSDRGFCWLCREALEEALGRTCPCAPAHRSRIP